MFARSILTALLAACAAMPGCGLPFTRVQPAETHVPRTPVEVPLIMEDGMIFVDCALKGRGPCRMRVDTGSQISILSNDVARAHGIPAVVQYPALLRGAAGSSWRLFRIAQVDEVAIGRVELRDLDCLLLDVDQDDRHGYLGFSAFSDLLLTLDFPRRRIVLSRGALPPPNGCDVLPYELVDHTPVVTMRLDGRPYPFLLDTGFNGYLRLPVSMAPTLRYRQLPTAEIEIQTINRTQRERAGRIAGRLGFGQYAWVDPPVVFGGDGGMVGVRLLRDLVVTFDQKNRRVRFTK